MPRTESIMTIAEIRESISLPPDRIGECDGCHGHFELWADSVTEGLFEFCQLCWLDQIRLVRNQPR